MLNIGKRTDFGEAGRKSFEALLLQCSTLTPGLSSNLKNSPFNFFPCIALAAKSIVPKPDNAALPVSLR